MRNLKKLLAVLVSVAVMLTAVIPAFAAEAAKTPAQIAEELGVLKGGSDGVTDAYLALGTKRIQAAIMLLRLKGLEETARAYDESTVNFKDANQVSGDAVNLLAYLKNTESLGWQGGPSGNFTPNADATPQMLYKALLEALGYKQGVDFEYSEVLGFAKALGMGDIASKAKLTNGDLATAVVEALGTKLNGSNETLAEKMAADNADFATKAAELGLINTATIDALAAVTIAFGADAAAVKAALPELVTVKYADGTSIKKAVTWGAVDTSKEGEQAIQGTVDGIGAKASIKVTVATMPLDFTLSATSYKEVTVTFNKAVATDLLVKGNFAINGSDAISVIAAADGKSIVLEASAAIAQQGKFEVTCKKAVGFAADTKKSLEGVIDATPPSVEKVEAVSNNEIKVTFTEPVTNFLSLSNFKIDGFYFGANVPSVSGRALTIKTTARLTAAAHKLYISNSLKDYGNWTLAAKEYDFTVATDTAAPKFVSISATQTKATIEFDEEIAAVGSYTVPAGVGVTTTSIDGKKFIINFSSTSALPVSEVTIKVKDVEDKYGNKSAEIPMTVTAQPDQTRPAFVGATTDEQKSIILEFTKDVDLATATAANVVVKDKDSNTVSTTVAYAKDSSNNDVKTKLVVKKSDTLDFASGNYTVTLVNITDINPLKNVILPVMTTVSVADKTRPQVSTIKADGSFKLYVTFSEEVNEATAEDKANYTYVTTGNLIKGLNGSTTVELMYDKKTVLVTFPSTGDDSVNVSTIASLQIAAVQDLAANVLYTVATSSINFGSIAAAPSVSSAKVTGEQTIVLTLSDKVVASTLTASDFQVSAGAGAYNLNIINIAYNDDNKEITLTINEKLNNRGNYVSDSREHAVAVKTIATCNLKNAFGQALVGNDSDTVTDVYAPVASIASAVYNSAAGTVAITINFAEQLDGIAASITNNPVDATSSQFIVFLDGAARTYTATYAESAGTSTMVFTVSGVSGMKDKTADVKFFKAPTATITDEATADNALANFDLSKAVTE